MLMAVVIHRLFWLRERYGYTGDIRVIGEVYRDQLNFLERVGATQFELAEDQDPQDALNGFDEFSVLYQPSADEGKIFLVVVEWLTSLSTN